MSVPKVEPGKQAVVPKVEIGEQRYKHVNVIKWYVVMKSFHMHGFSSYPSYWMRQPVPHCHSRMGHRWPWTHQASRNSRAPPTSRRNSGSERVSRVSQRSGCRLENRNSSCCVCMKPNNLDNFLDSWNGRFSTWAILLPNPTVSHSCTRSPNRTCIQSGPKITERHTSGNNCK